MSLKTTLPSGAELVVELAALEPAEQLLDVLLAGLKKVDLDFSSLENEADVAGPDINTIKNIVCQLVGSRELRDAVYACATKCLYNGQRVTRATFEPAGARRDFVPFAWEVVSTNVAPFFEGVVSAFLDSKAASNPRMAGVTQLFSQRGSPAPASSPSA